MEAGGTGTTWILVKQNIVFSILLPAYTFTSAEPHVTCSCLPSDGLQGGYMCCR